MATVQVDLDVYNYLVAQGMGGAETASSILRRALLHTIEIDDDLLSLFDVTGDFARRVRCQYSKYASSIFKTMLRTRIRPRSSFILPQAPEPGRGMPPTARSLVSSGRSSAFSMTTR